MEQRRFEFVLRAEQPIAHAEETLGNSSVIMRRKVRQPGGGWSRVPYVTGDTMRHGLREAAALAYLDAAGLLGKQPLTESALRLLFSGGMMMGGAAGGTIRLDEYREVCDLFPPLALLGGCAQNRVIQGRLFVDDATLVCTEQADTLPEWVKEYSGTLESCRAHVEEVQRVRMDPSLDPGRRKLLTAEEAEQVERRLADSEKAIDQQDIDAARSSMMPRRHERIAQGSLFWWSVTATCYSELDADTFVVMCATFLADARVGGKKGTGHGLLKPVAARDVKLLAPKDRAEIIEPTELGPRVGELFRAHVGERREKIAEFLSAVRA